MCTNIGVIVISVKNALTDPVTVTSDLSTQNMSFLGYPKIIPYTKSGSDTDKQMGNDHRDATVLTVHSAAQNVLSPMHFRDTFAFFVSTYQVASIAPKDQELSFTPSLSSLFSHSPLRFPSPSSLFYSPSKIQLGGLKERCKRSRN